MRNLFFYGTLRHLPLLEIVLGRGLDMLDLSDADLPGYLVSAVAEGPFPMVEISPGDTAKGVLLRGLTGEDVARLDFYEGSFAYDLVQVKLTNGETADVYVPQPGRWTPLGPWDLGDWDRDWGALSCHAAREVMGYMGTKTRDDVAAMFPMIRKRAGSKVNAAASHHGSGTLHGKVNVVSTKRSYAHFYALDDMNIQHEHFDGTMSEPLARAVFVAADAAIMLPYDPVRDRVLLVEQIRMGPIARGDRTVWQLEPIAGHIDPGETPEQAVHREALEEAGLSVSALEKVAEVYASPGNSTEFYYVFVGLAELPDVTQRAGGLEAEGEDIRSHVMSFDALIRLVETRDAANAPLVIAAYWLAHNRARLRGADSVKA
jgi:nudix-type nucleoside diphosphatase (YffH/AdpP family)